MSTLVKALSGERQGAHVVEMQRRRLLLAIGEVVSESGLEAATIGRVCEQAGVSRRTFYEQFTDREDCFLAAFNQAIEQITQKLTPVYTFEEATQKHTPPGAYPEGHRHPEGHRQASWRERLRSALSLLLEWLDADPNIARLCIVEAPRAGSEVLERRRTIIEGLVSFVDEGRDESRASSPGGLELPALTAQGVVGGALSVIHARLHDHTLTGPQPLVELTGPLMAMIVHPYLGPEIAREELERPTPTTPRLVPRTNAADPFKGLAIRFTYRTARVLATIARESEHGHHPSNRHIADTSGIADEGQMSRLLRRLQICGLIENRNKGPARGEPNAWTLTKHGHTIHAAIDIQAMA